jgi:type I restriction enzyme S subunit
MSDYPSEWVRGTLREACDKILDGTHFSPKSKSGPRLYLTSKNIKQGILDLSDTSFISEEEHREIYARCDVRRGDILFTKDGANTGNAAINTLKEEFSLLSSVAVIRPSTFRLDTGYAFQWLLSEGLQAQIKSRMAGNAISRLTLEKINQLPILLPPLPEQQKIAEILSMIDTQIERNSQRSSKYSCALKAFIDQGVDSLIANSTMVPLLDLLSEKPANGISPPETEGTNGILAPGIDCITASGFEAKRLKRVLRPCDYKRYIIQNGDFFITRSNTPALVGMCGVATSVKEEMIYPDLMIRLRFINKIHAPYLESVLRSSYYRRLIQNAAQGTSQSMVKLNSQIISNIKVPIPGDPLATAFVEDVRRLLNTIKSQKAMNERLVQLKSGLSDDLLSGRKRVSV